MIGILGADPGLTGALALCRGGHWVLLDMPIVDDTKHHEINGAELCRWLRERRLRQLAPAQGVTSMLSFGCAYGATKMALTACGAPYAVVTPAKWKPAVGIVKGSDKKASRQRALQLFPDQAKNLARRKDHARADAMLLAFYGVHHSRLMVSPIANEYAATTLADYTKESTNAA